ncbi:MAG: fibronectin type III domain-containing protein, partial [Coriobacteriales bacterium]|nr:fibronectin type III domain-containing protein [Coriobacteriales bacterium]
YKGSAKATFSITLAKARLATVGNTAKSGFSASWAKVAGAKSYELQWRRAGGKWKTVSAKGTSKLVAGLKPGGLYQFRVCAVAGETKGAWSKVSRRYLRSVKGVNATVRKAGTVTASWAADPEADLGYVVKVRYEKGGAVVATASVAAGKTKATVKVPKSGRRLWVEVRPVRASGGKAYSGILHGSWAK